MSMSPEAILMKFGRAEAQTYGRLNVRTLGDEDAQLTRNYLLKGLIYKGDLIFITGESGSGKTTLTQYITLAIAQGRSIFGRRVKQGRVLYLAFEGKDLFLMKMSVFEKRYGSSRNIVYVTQSLALLQEGPFGQDANLLVKIVKDERIDAVVCDTWSKMMAGGDDNSHKDASAVIGVLDRIREETGAAVIVNAHPNRTNPNDVSGSLTVRKDCDALIRVSGTSGTRTVESLKLRFDQTGYAFAFKLNRVVLGIDADGDEITSVDLEEETDRPCTSGTPPRLSDYQAMVLQDATKLLENPHHTALGITAQVKPREGMPRVMAVRRDALQQELQQNGRLESKSGEPMTLKDRGKLRDSLASLERKGQLCSTSEWVWLP